jgi:hypothetical protein
MAFNSTTLDAPDTAVRRIMLKRSMGQPLTNKEFDRLATRMSVEAETNRSGGTVKNAITPRRLSPAEQGAQDRQYNDAYAGGRDGPVQRAPQTPAAKPPTAPVAQAPATPPAAVARVAPAGQMAPPTAQSGPAMLGKFPQPGAVARTAPAAPAPAARPVPSMRGRYNGVNVDPTATDPTEPVPASPAAPADATLPAEVTPPKKKKPVARSPFMPPKPLVS